MVSIRQKLYSKAITVFALLFFMNVQAMLQKDFCTDIKTLQSRPCAVTALTFSPDSTKLAVGHFDGSVRLYDPKQEALFDQKLHAGIVDGLAFSKNGKLLASCASRNDERNGCNEVTVWELQDNELTLKQKHAARLKGRSIGVNVIFDGNNTLMTGLAHDYINVTDLNTQNVDTLGDNRCAGYWLCYNPDKKILISFSCDSSQIQFWNLNSKKCIHSMEIAARHCGMSISPNGQTLAVSGPDKTILLMDTSSYTINNILKGQEADVFRLAFSPNGKMLASLADDNTVWLWCTKKWICTRVLRYGPTGQGLRCRALTIAFSPDGKTLAVGTRDGVVDLYTLPNSTLNFAKNNFTDVCILCDE